MKKRNYRIFSDTQASNLIDEIICSSASPVANCEHCGRVHFNSTGEFMDEGELGILKMKMRGNPEKYNSHDQQIHWGVVEGKNVVINCQCNFLAAYEKKIWSDLFTICEYLKRRAEGEYRDAKNSFGSVSDMTKAVDRMPVKLASPGWGEKGR